LIIRESFFADGIDNFQTSTRTGNAVFACTSTRYGNFTENDVKESLGDGLLDSPVIYKKLHADFSTSPDASTVVVKPVCQRLLLLLLVPLTSCAPLYDALPSSTTAALELAVVSLSKN
jgi:hypothetical protein